MTLPRRSLVGSSLCSPARRRHRRRNVFRTASSLLALLLQRGTGAVEEALAWLGTRSPLGPRG
jgi:hypothetical protein